MVRIGVYNMMTAMIMMMIRKMLMTKMMNMVMISTSSFSELEIEAFPGVVHVRVAECDVVHGVVADRTNHLMMMMRTAIGNVDDCDNEYADYDNSNQSLALILCKGMMLIMTNMMPMTIMSMTVMSMLMLIIYNDDDDDDTILQYRPVRCH